MILRPRTRAPLSEDLRCGGLRAALVTSILLLALFGAACSNDAAPSTATAPSIDATEQTVAGAASRVFRDPETGELSSTPPPGRSPLQAVTDPLNFSDEGLETEILPDGTERIDLRGRFRTATYARVGEDGSVTVEHLPAPEVQH